MQPSHAVTPLNNSTIEITIPIEWYGLGKDACMVYAERIARAVYLGETHRASNAVADASSECVRVKLTKVRR